jgi:hypothetical protein
VGLFDPWTGRRVGPLLPHPHPLLGLAFTPDGRELVTVSRTGRCVRWALGWELPREPGEWRTLLEATTGMRLEGDQLVPLTVDEHRQRREEAEKLPAGPAGPAFSAPAWYAGQALDALEAGQPASARFLLDRWHELEPDAWLPLALRATSHSLEGSAKEAEADLGRAARLDKGGQELKEWKRHQEVVQKMLARPGP